MANCLLIGNGLNRCLENSIAWGDLLKDIATKRGITYNSGISMPLEFERIVNEYLIKSNLKYDSEIYAEIKDELAYKIKQVHLPENSIHKRILSLKTTLFNFNAIITTNYDYLLEKIFDNNYKYAGSNKNKYMFNHSSILQGIRFYHIHGHVSNVKSICLGYEHYMGIVENLRKNINTKKNESDLSGKKMAILQILDSNKNIDTWAEMFYRDNIGIVGLGLDECESDLWWLITHRAYLYYTNYENAREYITNSIVYYDIVDDVERLNEDEERARKLNYIKQKNKHILLENSHIVVHKYLLSKYKTYESAYNSIFNHIEHNRTIS